MGLWTLVAQLGLLTGRWRPLQPFKSVRMAFAVACHERVHRDSVGWFAGGGGGQRFAYPLGEEGGGGILGLPQDWPTHQPTQADPPTHPPRPPLLPQ